MVNKIDTNRPVSQELDKTQPKQKIYDKHNVSQEKVKQIAVDAFDLSSLDRHLKKSILKAESNGLNSKEEKYEYARLGMVKKVLSHLSSSNESKDVTRIIYQLLDSEPSKEELIIIDQILSFLGTDENKTKKKSEVLLEILRGAHVRIDDQGKLYNRWSKLQNHERISSHECIKGKKQYGITGSWVHEFLFGCVKENGKTKTFFQLENTPWAEGLKNRAGHSVDAMKYVLTRENIGPYGSSAHTDKKPIRFRLP